MPVSYPWARTFRWYDFEPTDYRWFYNMLLVASNAGKSTPQNIPIVSWVHFSTVFYPDEPDSSVVPMSQESYQELLWHMLLRGTDTFAMWCSENEYAEEVRLVQEVYAAAQQYGAFLEHGLPITFEVPSQPGAVVSGLVLEDQVLVRRTDFGSSTEPVEVLAGTNVITVDHAPGQCQIITLGND